LCLLIPLFPFYLINYRVIISCQRVFKTNNPLLCLHLISYTASPLCTLFAF
jgi:hypothetical protein